MKEVLDFDIEAVSIELLKLILKIDFKIEH
jgi:hypothetical protein